MWKCPDHGITARQHSEIQVEESSQSIWAVFQVGIPSFWGGTGAIGWLLALLFPVLLILWLPLELFVSVVAAIRRFHDMDRSGWHLLFGLIPFVGVVVIVILLFSRYEKHKQMGVVGSGIRPRVSMQVSVYTGSSGCRAHYLTIVFNPCAESPKGKVTIRLPGCEGYLTSRWHSRCV